MWTATNQATGRVWTKFRPNKIELLQSIWNWKEKVEVGSRCQLKAIHIDWGGEFFNTAMQEWCKNLQIKLEITVGYFFHRQMELPKVVTDPFQKEQMPGSYWKLACICVTYLKNRSPSRDKNVTSWEEWYGKRPSAKDYRVFGCPAYVQIPKEKRKS